jgi:exopolysaccharide biosynthesis polyprenyl glycosylphosphotransferase
MYADVNGVTAQVSISPETEIRTAQASDVASPRPRLRAVAPEAELPESTTTSRTRPYAEIGVIVAGDLLAVLIARVLGGDGSGFGLLYSAAALWMLGFAGLYRSRLTFRVLDDLPKMLSSLGLPLLAVGAWGAVNALPSSFFAATALMPLTLVAIRQATYSVIRTWRRRHRRGERTIIVGAGEVGWQLARVLRERPEHGLTPVGIVDSLPELSSESLPLPHLGTLDQLDVLLREHGIRRVIVAFGPMPERHWVGVMRAAVANNVEIHVVPRFFDLAVGPRDSNVDEIWGIPLYRVRRAALRSSAWGIKRAVDILVAGTALVLSAPIMALLALAVRLSDPQGPILFRQRRVGQDGRHFEMLKFRTMRTDHVDASWETPTEEAFIPAGRLIRATSLDELPQLWNVLVGDMSIVGPRPERPHFAEPFAQEVPGYADRHRLPVGLTGWAQVNGLRGDTSIAERARFDNFYIEHWSLWFDIKVLMRTGSTLIRDFVRGRQ